MLVLFFFSFLFSVIFTLRTKGVLLKAQTPAPTGVRVLPVMLNNTSGSKDVVQMRTFGFVTLTPPGGNSSVTSGDSGWPFPKKSPAQYRRIDAGWDLEYHQKTPVFAIASGTVSKAGNNPGGFGVDYPLLTLDAPICGYKQLYYGHVHLDRSVLGKHVNVGDVMANTDPNGVNSPSNWLEVGFWRGGPVGNSQGAYPTLAGRQVKSWMLSGNCSGN